MHARSKPPRHGCRDAVWGCTQLDRVCENAGDVCCVFDLRSDHALQVQVARMRRRIFGALPRLALRASRPAARACASCDPRGTNPQRHPGTLNRNKTRQLSAAFREPSLRRVVPTRKRSSLSQLSLACGACARVMFASSNMHRLRNEPKLQRFASDPTRYIERTTTDIGHGLRAQSLLG